MQAFLSSKITLSKNPFNVNQKLHLASSNIQVAYLRAPQHQNLDWNWYHIMRPRVFVMKINAT